jgi:transposase
MQNSTEIFSIALGLQEPWHVKKVIFNKDNLQLDIYLAFTKGYKFKNKDGAECTAHGIIEMNWQHLNFFQHKCYLHAKVPEVKQADGKVKTQAVPWATKESGFTLLFEDSSMLLTQNKLPANKAAKILKTYPNRLYNMINYWIYIANQNNTIQYLSRVNP